jgi:hypothetical protein
MSGLYVVTGVSERVRMMIDNESIDGVDYHLSIVNGEAFMEPGHDRVLQSTRIGNYTLYFSAKSAYRVYTPTAPATKEVDSGTVTQQRSER